MTRGAPDAPTWEVEVYLPGATVAAAEALVARVAEAAARTIADRTTDARFLGGTLAMDDELCDLRFSGERAWVEAVLAGARVADARISEVVAVVVDDRSAGHPA